jgi:hypothetical protein
MNSKDVHALNESYKATGTILNEEMYDCLRDGLSYAECCAQYPQECQQDQKSGVEEDKGGSPGRHPAKGIPFSDGKGEHDAEEPDFLRDVLGHDPEDYDGGDPDQNAMDRSSGDEAFNAMAETLEDISKHVEISWAGFDESQEFLINDVMVKVVGFHSADEA